jgi:hypothetical protein
MLSSNLVYLGGDFTSIAQRLHSFECSRCFAQGTIEENESSGDCHTGSIDF